MSVPQGERGYVAAYTYITVFEGRFTHCDDGNDVPGRVFAVKKDKGFLYLLVNTN